MTRRLVLHVVVVAGLATWYGAAQANSMRVIWDGPACIATEIQAPNHVEVDKSKLIVTVIKPLHWTNLPYSSLVRVQLSPEPFSPDYDRAQDVVTVDGGKKHTGEVSFKIGQWEGALQLTCVGEFENFTALAALPRTPRGPGGVYHLRGLERVDDATVETAMAQQQANKDARAAAIVQARDNAAAAAIQAKQREAATAIANAALITAMGQQPVGSTLFCGTDPQWPRGFGDAVDRQRLVCHLVGQSNTPPMMGAALLSSGWTIVSENRRTEHKFILTADMGAVEITEVTLKKTL